MGAFDLSPAALFAGLIVSGLGFAIFTYGRKESLFTPIFAGLALMALPMVVPGALLNLSIAGLMLAGLWIANRNDWL